MWDSKMMSSYLPTFLVETSFNQSFKFTVCMHAEIRNLCDSLIPRCVRIIFLQKFWEVKKFGVLRLVKKSLNKEVLRESILKIYIPFTKTSSHLTIIASYFLQYMPGVNRSAFPYIMY